MKQAVMQGASNVRCARCGDITAVPLHGGEQQALTCLASAG